MRDVLQANPGCGSSARSRTATRPSPRPSTCLPDIVLLDLTLPRLPGLEAMRAIMSGWPQIKILLLNRQIRAQHIIEALQIGARGIVLHERLTTDLEPAIACVSAGGYWLGEEQVEGLVSCPAPARARTGLARAEELWIDPPRGGSAPVCIVDGCSNREIASQFGLSEETVKRHLSNIFDKVGVSTRLELALFALANHLVNP